MRLGRCLGLKCLSLAFHWTWPYNPKQGRQYTSIYTGERERYIYANILHNVQAICKANSISFFALSQSTTPPFPHPVSSNVQKESKMQSRRRTDWLTDWQVKSVDRNLPHPSQRLNAEPVRRLISLSLAIRWRSPVKPLHPPPPATVNVNKCIGNYLPLAVTS